MASIFMIDICSFKHICRCDTTEEQDDPNVCDISQSSAAGDADDTTSHVKTTDDERTTTCWQISMRQRTKQYLIMWSVFAIIALCLFGVTHAIGGWWSALFDNAL
jgi:hypothetical protein